MIDDKKNPISFDPLLDEETGPESAELDFEDDEVNTSAGERRPQEEVRRNLPPQRERDAGLTGASHPGEGATDDDMTPDTLLPEDGSRTSSEAGSGSPADSTLRRVDQDEIGGGEGLDEAELARARPLDGKPWSQDR